jgi:hypothetical protein
MYLLCRLDTEQEEEDRFTTEGDAIRWAMYELPSDDTAYVIVDEPTGDYVCIVFQGVEWRPS